MNRKRTISVILILISIVLAAAIIYKLVKYFEPTKGLEKSKITLQDRELDIIFGNDSAQNTVYMYSNYGCPVCRKFLTNVIPAMETEFFQTKRLKINMRLTLKTENMDILNSMRASVCVNHYGNFEYLHQLLLSQSNIIYTAEFENMVNSFVDKDPFVAECIMAGASDAYLNSNLEEFEQLGFKGTPSFVLNGYSIQGFGDYLGFRKKILQILDK
jgi:protein-disulfide isomerase